MSSSAARRWSASASRARRSTSVGAVRVLGRGDLARRVDRRPPRPRTRRPPRRAAPRGPPPRPRRPRAPRPALPATSAVSASCCAVRRSCSPASASRRRSSRAAVASALSRSTARRSSAARRSLIVARAASSSAEIARVLGLGRLELVGQAALLLRPRLVVALLRAARRARRRGARAPPPPRAPPRRGGAGAARRGGARSRAARRARARAAGAARCARARPASGRRSPPRAPGRPRRARARPRASRARRRRRRARRGAPASSASSATTSPVSSRPRVSAISLSTVRSCSAAVAWRRSGASCEPDLALQQQGALEVAAHLAELELGALAAALVRAETGGLLDLAAPVLRLAGQERLDLALADDGVQLLAQADLGQQLDDVGEPAGGLVDGVLRRAVARHAAHHADLGRGQRQRAVGVVEGELDLGGAAGAAPVAAGEDDVLHGRAADGGGALLAERPDDGVGEVALAAPVGADDHADAGLEEELGLLGERLEALEAKRLEVHLSRPRWPRRRPPARRRPRRARRPRRGRPPGLRRRPASSPAGVRRERLPRRRALRAVRRARDCSSCSASAAASCSARFLLVPNPRPSDVAVDDGLDLELAVVRRPAEAEHLVARPTGRCAPGTPAARSCGRCSCSRRTRCARRTPRSTAGRTAS